jgi:radical SAM-linked protein
MSLRGHLDMVRVLPRVFRRAGLSLHYTEGFSPRPMLVFGPALALGMQSVAEYVDFALTEPKPEAALLSALQAASEEGLGFEAVRCLSESEPALSKRIAISYLARLPAAPSERYAECLEAFFRAPAFPVQVTRKGKPRSVDAKAIVLEAVIKSAGTSAGLWDGQPSETVLELRVAESSGTPSLKPAELVKALLAVDVPPTAITRAGCWSRTNDGELGDPLEPVLEPLRAL